MKLIDYKRIVDCHTAAITILARDKENAGTYVKTLNAKMESAKDDKLDIEKIKKQYEIAVINYDQLSDACKYFDFVYLEEYGYFFNNLVSATQLPKKYCKTIAILYNHMDDNIHIYFGHEKDNSPTHFLGHYIVNLKEQSLSRCEVDGPVNKNGERIMYRYPFIDRGVIGEDDIRTDKAGKVEDVVILPPESEK